MADVLLTHSYHLALRPEASAEDGAVPAARHSLRRRAVARATEFPSRCSTACCRSRNRAREALRAHQPKIVAIYEDDFNFLTKMCLTRMREVAWEMIAIAHEIGARVVVHGSDATDHAAEFLERGAECVLEGEAEYSLLLLRRR